MPPPLPSLEQVKELLHQLFNYSFSASLASEIQKSADFFIFFGWFNRDCLRIRTHFEIFLSEESCLEEKHPKLNKIMIFFAVLNLSLSSDSSKSNSCLGPHNKQTKASKTASVQECSLLALKHPVTAYNMLTDQH